MSTPPVSTSPQPTSGNLLGNGGAVSGGRDERQTGALALVGLGQDGDGTAQGLKGEEGSETY